jgi:glycosyltransferase involved in cell wall biosynthesis
MVKAADAFAEEGYDVSVISGQFDDWADEADRSLLATRWSRWRWTTVDYRRRGARARSVWTAVRVKAAKQFIRARGIDRIGMGTAARIRERIFPELVSAAVRTRPTLIYGGGNAFAATAVAAAKAGVPFALDLEDFHGDDASTEQYAALTGKIVREVLPKAAVLTAASRAISEEYRSVYGLDVIPIHNVFPLPSVAPTPREWDGNLRLYWFGQSVGPGRGIGEAIRAVGAAKIRSELTVRGATSEEYLQSLRAIAAEFAPALAIAAADRAPPDDMIDLCRVHDVGIAIADPEVNAEELRLSNRPPTYILAGLAVALTDTRGQHELGTDLGEGALLCPEGDVEGFARGLRDWSDNPDRLANAKAAAWEAAKRRWHWEHPEERDKLLSAIAGVFG